MSETIYEKNLKAFENNFDYRHATEKLKNLNYDSDKLNNVRIDRDLNGNKIIGVVREEYTYYFNSKYGNDYIEEEIYKLNDFNYKGIIIIFGGSNYEAVREILKNLKDENKVLVIEPDLNVFLKAMDNFDISDIIQNKNIFIAINGINENILQEFMIAYVTYSNLSYMKFLCMPNYNQLYKNEYLEVLKYCKSWVGSNVITRNTLIIFAEERGENTICNIRDFVNQYSVNQIRNRLVKINNIQEIPAIMVAAGPSLDKNIEEIKKAEGKSMIFAVDTALKTLLKHNIVPDIAMTIDGHKDTMLFANRGVKDINMIVCPCTNRKNYSVLRGKRFYFGDGNEYIDDIYEKNCNEKLLRFETGGSVANNLFSAIQLFGFKKIIMVGQDLAYPNNKMHTESAYGTGKNNDVSDKQLFEVEDIYGNMVLTESNMDAYRKWFEQQIVRYPDLEVIDATEGGAKIHGTNIMKLTDAIEQYCKNDIDIKNILNEIKPVFNDEQKKEILDRIDKLTDKLEEMKNTAKDGIKKYERLETLNIKGKITGKEFKDLSIEIGKISKELLNTPEMDIVSIYNQKEEYEVLGNVYDEKNNAYDDIKDIVKSGIKMMNSYITSIDKTISVINSVYNISEENIKTEIYEVNKNLDYLKKKCAEDDISEINVALKKTFNALSALLTDIISYEKYKKISLKELKENVYNVVELLEKYMEKDEIAAFADNKEDNIKWEALN